MHEMLKFNGQVIRYSKLRGFEAKIIINQNNIMLFKNRNLFRAPWNTFLYRIECITIRIKVKIRNSS